MIEDVTDILAVRRANASRFPAKPATSETVSPGPEAAPRLMSRHGERNAAMTAQECCRN
jgi:hypothetical protein